MTEEQLQAQMEAGARALQARDLAFAIADACCALDIETNHYTVVSDGVEWRDLRMLHNADLAPAAERAVRYLTLRGLLVRHPVFPNLVRVCLREGERGEGDEQC